VAGCEDRNFVVLVHELEALTSERPDREPCDDVLPGLWVLDKDFFFGVEVLFLLAPLVRLVSFNVNEGLIEVEDQEATEPRLLEGEGDLQFFREVLVVIVHQFLDFVNLKEHVLGKLPVLGDLK